MTNDEKIALALEKALNDDIAEYEKLPDHSFSPEFERKMKALFKNGITEEKQKSRLRIGRRLPAAVIIALSAFLLMGATTAAYVLWNNFHVQDRGLYSLLNITDVEDCPKTLEERYELTADLSGFTKNVISDNDLSYYVEYDNIEKGIHIAFSQDTKNSAIALNTEDALLPREATVNGFNGIYFETKYGTKELIWDTGDYLISLSVKGISENDLFELAKFVQKVE